MARPSCGAGTRADAPRWLKSGARVGRRVTQVLGLDTRHVWRHARRVAVGDRRAPTAQTPALVLLPGDPPLEPAIAPFESRRLDDRSPQRLSFTGRAPLAVPFEAIGPSWTADVGHVLPPVLEDADFGPNASLGELLPLSWQALRHDERLTSPEVRPQVVVLTDALQVAGHPGRLPEALLTIRIRWPGALIWTPGLAGPDNLALLAWMGVDLIDTTRARAAAAASLLLTDAGPRRTSPDMAEPTDLDAQLTRLIDELAAVRVAIAEGHLRHLVELRGGASPRSVEHLRHHDRLCSAATTGHLRAVAQEGQRFRANTSQTLDDALVTDWVERIATQHEPPASQREVLLLLPCSARKPYRDSRSHQRFLRHIPHRVPHQVMVTSPLGLVPRELEDLWPAQHYDVPVTGDWSQEEMTRVRDLVARLIARVGYHTVIDHAAVGACADGVSWVDTREGVSAGDAGALGRLEAAVEMASERLAQPGMKSLLLEQLRAVARWQLGGDAWLEGAHIAGRPPRWLLSAGPVQLAQWHPHEGRLALSKDGVRRWHDHGLGPWAELTPGTDWRGDLFATNVIDHAPDIRQGDELRVLLEGRLIGCARATQPGWAWSGAPGRLAKARHRL